MLPAVMLTSASEMVECSHPQWIVHIVTAVSAYFRSSATANHCPGIRYVGCIWTCASCAAQKRDNYDTDPLPYHSYTQEFKDGTIIEYCTRCHYVNEGTAIR